MTDLTEQDRLAAMAYVDGELAPQELAAFERRLPHEPALAQAVARERALRASLTSAYAPALEEPVPAALLDLLAMPDPAANESAAGRANDAWRGALPRERRWRWHEWAAMAACLVAGVLLGARGLAPPARLGGDALALGVASDGSVIAQGELRGALEQHVAGIVLDPNSPVVIGLTFRNHAKQYCRTFTLDNASSGIACKQSDGWVVATLEHTANAPHVAGTYRTAASPYSPALLQAIDALRDGDTLDAAGEKAAQAKGWAP